MANDSDSSGASDAVALRAEAEERRVEQLVEQQASVDALHTARTILGRLWAAIDSDEDEFDRLHKRRTLAEILGVGERFISPPKRKNHSASLLEIDVFRAF